ncbi:hypothetical protein DPMN_092999 [Dreissena polymorpha]|uniref:Uncharacterized protein n=1 Tax=Dreissena polymorpha TaxID=45954 RepID=A0A9D4R1H7_DREPO|nr:hypothetical protein DPMN_092999 [Dreissena polymorpha]
MSGRGRGVRRRVGKAVAKRGHREGRGMRAAVDPAPVKEQRASRLRRNATETAPEPEPALAPVPRTEPEEAVAAEPPEKRRRADENAANGEVIDFRTADGLPRGHNVGEHEALACNANDNLPKLRLSRMDYFHRISILLRQTNDGVSIRVPLVA